MGVIDLGQELRLPGEALRVLRIGVRLEQLHRDRGVRPRVSRAKHCTDPTRPDLPLDGEALIQEAIGRGPGAHRSSSSFSEEVMGKPALFSFVHPGNTRPPRTHL